MDLFITSRFWLNKMLIDGLDLFWCFYPLFGLSIWQHSFTAEDPSVSKWFLKCTNKLIYILYGLWVSTFSIQGELFI